MGDQPCADLQGDLDLHCLYGPSHEKTCLRGFRQSEFQTGLVSHRDYLEC